MFTVADIDPTATNSPKFRLIAVQCVRPRPTPREVLVPKRFHDRYARARVLLASCALRCGIHTAADEAQAHTIPCFPVPMDARAVPFPRTLPEPLTRVHHHDVVQPTDH